MNIIKKISLMAAACFFFASCGKEAEPGNPFLVPSDVTIAGTWKLTEKNGKPSGENPYVYIVFDRSEHTFSMYQNVNSGTAQCKTGTYSISADGKGNHVISGIYDHDSGLWNSEYYISELTGESMKWTVTDNADDVSVYTRCGSVPEEIVSGSHWLVLQ